MSEFNFVAFCKEFDIPFVTSGENVKRIKGTTRKEINVKCPFCADDGDPDPSYHLGIDPVNHRFSCWRNKEKHSGKRLTRVLAKLAGISWQEAKRRLGDNSAWYDEDLITRFFDDPIGFFEQDQEIYRKPSPVKLPSQFRNFSKYPTSQQPFKAYLSRRGFHDVDALIKEYNLHYSISGTYQDRLIVPVTNENGEIVNWTGRSIKEDDIRYLSGSEDDGIPWSIKDSLLNEHSLLEGTWDTLYLLEGPFDSLKVDFYVKEYGHRATCLFGLTMSDSQLNKLANLKSHFNKIITVLDANEIASTLNVYSNSNSVVSNLGFKFLNDSYSDPGAMNQDEILKEFVYE